MKMENAFLLMAIAMAALFMTSTVQAESTSLRRRASRFLAEDNPRAVSCRKNPSICDSIGTNLTCCNNKCVDLATEKNHCGRCGVECKYTQACCRGKCVYLTYDKRHCGRCNNRCKIGDFCIYGLCEYI